MYKSSVMEALNARRSSCDQMGCKIVHSYLSRTWKPLSDGVENEAIPSFLSIATLSKLRKSVMDEEHAAFQLVFSEFMECVSRKRAWGKQKYIQLISDASIWVVTEFRISTWINGSRSFIFSRRVYRMGRFDGVFTAATKGNLVFGGWTKQGRNHFNYY
jgi:hypothetical protein